MNRRGITIVTALLLGGGASHFACANGDQAKQAPIAKAAPAIATKPTIRLEIVIDGGFAYIPEGANTLNIAYLNDWTYTGKDDANPETPESQVFCDVKQIGTTLQVQSGEVVVPSPAQTTFDLDGTAVSFPALRDSTGVLAASRPSRTSSPFKPANPDSNAEWADLRYISSLKDEHGAKLNPKWRFLVNGFMTLRGGTLTGQKPQRFAGQAFDFRRGGSSQFVQSLTDRTVYSVDVAAEQIEIELESDAGLKKVAVKPSAGPARTVRLMLMGMHTKTASFGPGDELVEHCTFYQLFDPVPQPTSWLRPHALPQPGNSRVLIPHSPGFFCPGDWF